MVFTSLALMFVGLCLVFFGSRAWGGISDPLATVYALTFVGGFSAYVCTNSEQTRKIASALLIGLSLGALDQSRIVWGLTGVALLVCALVVGIIAERTREKN